MRNKHKIVGNYCLIEEDVGRPLYSEELEIIKRLTKKFPTRDLYFKINGSKVALYLSAVDLKSFKELTHQLIKEYGIGTKYPHEKNLFLELIAKIEEIRSYGIKGGKRIYVTYAGERKVQNRKKKMLQRGSYFYTNGANFSKEINEVPLKYVNKIIAGDSEKVLKDLPSTCVDLILTSPPYNFGLGYDTSEDGISWNRYFDKLFAIFKECIRVLKYGGRIIVDVQPLFSDYIPTHHIISNFFLQNKLIWKGEILWEKHNYNCKYTAWGSWRSPSSPYLKYTWEFLEIFCKGDLKKEGQKENIDITGEEFKKWVYSRWDIAPEGRMKEFNHPAMFPESLVERVLKLFSYRNDFILDPFNGVGSTTVVAKKLGRRFLGIDISEEYCRIAKKRLEEIPK